MADTLGDCISDNYTGHVVPNKQTYVIPAVFPIGNSMIRLISILEEMEKVLCRSENRISFSVIVLIFHILCRLNSLQPRQTLVG